MWGTRPPRPGCRGRAGGLGGGCNPPPGGRGREAEAAPGGASSPAGGGGSETITPGDPNEKIGPAGCGTLSAVATDDPLSYVIYFENVSTASAPAQEVVVTDQLPAGLDRYSLELGEVAFGDQVVDALAGLSSGRTTVPLNNSPYNVDVIVDYDPVTGLITWTLRTIDPLTNDLPDDALAGFLPPNDSTGRGEGHVAFTIRPLAGASSGTAISNAATIVFDTNAPIATAAWTNTIDTAAPSSRVTAVVPNAGGLSDERLVTWSGSDLPAGSEVSGYSIHVSEDGGEYAVWIADTTATSAVFRERPGSTYAFFSVARDCLGNEEPRPASADVTDVANAPDGDGDGVADDRDNCPALSNANQADLDGDGMGDACDTCTDGDGDGFGDPGFPFNTCAPDNCPVFPNPDQGADADGDGLDDGVECQLGTDPGKPDTDGDGYRDGVEVVAGSNPLDSGSVPAPPQAVDDAAMTLKGTPVTVQVLANDACAPGVTLSVSGVVQPPSHGTAVVAGAAIVYTPAAGYLGSDSFTYSVTDGVVNGGPATVTVSVYGRIRVRSYAAHDGWVLESTERSGRGGSLNAKATTIRIGDDKLDRQFRGILSFDTSAVPDDAVITAATLSFKRQGVVGRDPFRTHGSLVGDVIRGAFSRSAKLQLSDFQAAPNLRAGIGSFAKPLDGWYRGTFSDGAHRFVNTRGRTQIRLRFTKDDNDDRGADYLSIYSGNAVIDLRPVLDIEYSLP